MYSRQEASQLRQEFWTVFGQYMSPVLSAEGEKINWINFKTGEKHIYFKMEAGNNFAKISIEIAHPDVEIQKLFFNQFIVLQKNLNATLGEEWTWVLHNMEDGTSKVTSKIFTTLNDKSVLNKADWPDLISFFKPRLIRLDEFWSTSKYGFELLR